MHKPYVRSRHIHENSYILYHYQRSISFSANEQVCSGVLVSYTKWFESDTQSGEDSLRVCGVRGNGCVFGVMLTHFWLRVENGRNAGV